MFNIKKTIIIFLKLGIFFFVYYIFFSIAQKYNWQNSYSGDIDFHFKSLLRVLLGFGFFTIFLYNNIKILLNKQQIIYATIFVVILSLSYYIGVWFLPASKIIMVVNFFPSAQVFLGVWIGILFTFFKKGN